MAADPPIDITPHIDAWQEALAAHPVTAPKFTKPGVVERIYASLAAGNFRCTAAAEAGVSEDSVDDWVKRGEGDKPTFATSVRALRAQVEAARLTRVEVAEDWRAAAWLLERHNRPKYGDSKHLELTGKDGAPLITHDDLLGRLARLAAAPEEGSADPEPEPAGD